MDAVFANLLQLALFKFFCKCTLHSMDAFEGSRVIYDEWQKRACHAIPSKMLHKT